MEGNKPHLQPVLKLLEVVLAGLARFPNVLLLHDEPVQLPQAADDLRGGRGRHMSARAMPSPHQHMTGLGTHLKTSGQLNGEPQLRQELLPELALEASELLHLWVDKDGSAPHAHLPCLQPIPTM
jgi:hypothetical protein